LSDENNIETTKNNIAELTPVRARMMGSIFFLEQMSLGLTNLIANLRGNLLNTKNV
jgi:hypothetical protein